MDQFFSEGKKSPKQWFLENRVAILYTLIFHVLVLIVLVLVKVDSLKEIQELGVELEFEDKTLEKLLEEEEILLPADWLEQMLAERELSSNRAVNQNAENDFSEDISTDDYVDELLKELEDARNADDKERLEELQAILAAADYVPPTDNEDEETEEYSGPTTITYAFTSAPLDRGRVLLTVPVYRCQGSGKVKVEVVVAPDGRVLEAAVLQPVVGKDRVCFSKAAREAALSSMFRVDLGAPSRHICHITYSFMAQ